MHRNRKYIPDFSIGKDKIKILKNVTLQIPNLILPTRMLNISPIRGNVSFETVISALNNTKRTENVTLDDIGNILLVNLPRQNLTSGGLNLYKRCLTIKNFGMELRLPRKKQFSMRTLRCGSVLEFSTDVMITPKLYPPMSGVRNDNIHHLQPLTSD